MGAGLKLADPEQSSGSTRSPATMTLQREEKYRKRGIMPLVLVATVALALYVVPASAVAQDPPVLQGMWRSDITPFAAAAHSIEGDHSLWEKGDDIVQGRTPTSRPTYIVDPADGKIPYLPWAEAKKKEFRANVDAPTKLEHIDPLVRALLVGVPRSNHTPGEIQIVQVPGYVLFLYSSSHAFRVVPTDGRPHVSDSIKLWMGDSRGRWEGNTLVIDVTNQNDQTWLDSASFHGDALHVVERWTMVGPDTIGFEATMEDPSMFTQPWKIAYRINRVRDKGYEILEEARREGERDAARILEVGRAKAKAEGRDK